MSPRAFAGPAEVMMMISESVYSRVRSARIVRESALGGRAITRSRRKSAFISSWMISG